MLSPIAARISLILVGLLFLLPFLNPYHFFPLTNFYTEWLSFALGLAALVPLVSKRFWEEVEIPTLALWLLAFAAVLVAQIAWLDIAYPELSIIGALNVIWAALLVWLGRILARSCGREDLAVWLAAMLLLGGLLNAAAAALQFYGVDSLARCCIASLGLTKGGAYGNFGQNNHFADYISLALASTLYLHLTGRLSPALAALCGGIFLYALSLSGSRASWLYLAALVALGIWFRSRSADPHFTRAALLAALALPLFWLLQLALAHSGLALRAVPPGVEAAPVTPIDRFAEELAHGIFPQNGGSALGTRLYMWHQALLMFARHPLLGVGFGQYAGTFFEQAAELPRYHIPNYDRNSHNLVTQLLAETGIAGAGLVCAGLAGWLLGLRRRLALSAESWWLLGLLAVLFLHSLIEYPLWHTNFLGVAAVLLGFGSERYLRLHLTALSRFAFPVMLLAGCLALGRVLYAYRDLEQLMYPKVLPQNREEIVRRNQGLLQLHRDTLLAPYVELTYAGVIVPDRVNLPDKIALNSRVMRILPVPELAYRQVLLLGLAGESDAAQRELDRAVAVFPQRLKEFVSMIEELARREPDALGKLAASARAKLKEVDRY